MDREDILQRLKSLASPDAVAGMARYGISPHNTQETGSKPGRWIAADALRELTGEKVRARLGVS
jgi:hypothetical protein